MKIYSILGNSQKLDGGAMFGNVPKPLWQKWMPADELGRIDLYCRALLLVTDTKKILFETGIGAFFEPKLAERFGVQNHNRHILLESLNKVGFLPSDIDAVVLSHLHFDHAGGLLNTYADQQANGLQLVFSKATFYVGEEAWARAQKPHSRDKASFIPELPNLLQASGRLKLISSSSHPNLANIEFIQTQGHTPGQTHALIHGKNQNVFFCGDLVPGLPWLHLPITMGYDRFPELLIDEKESLYNKLKPQNDILFFTHDTSFAGATFENKGGKFVADKTWQDFQGYPI